MILHVEVVNFKTLITVTNFRLSSAKFIESSARAGKISYPFKSDPKVRYIKQTKKKTWRVNF